MFDYILHLPLREKDLIAENSSYDGNILQSLLCGLQRGGQTPTANDKEAAQSKMGRAGRGKRAESQDHPLAALLLSLPLHIEVFSHSH